MTHIYIVSIEHSTSKSYSEQCQAYNTYNKSSNVSGFQNNIISIFDFVEASLSLEF